MKTDDLLIEIQTEELPPKALLTLADAFSCEVQQRLTKAGFTFTASRCFATPRRLAVIVNDLLSATEDQLVTRKGPALTAAFKDGKPTPACEGFARSCGVSVAELEVIKTEQGEWMSYQQRVLGQSIEVLLPAIVEQAALALPIPKRMRWGESSLAFVRPIQGVMLLYGNKTITATLFNMTASNTTRGHRFLAPETLTIKHPSDYVDVLKNKGRVLVDIDERREKIRELANDCVATTLGREASVHISSEALLNEVTGLVEWPVALCGKFEDAFLQVPSEVLISAMQDHQRYFPVMDKTGKLLPYFITMSNIESRDVARVIHGNERVLRARLSDAAFFFNEDKKESLSHRLERLKGIVFQAKLGSLYDKVVRVSRLADQLAPLMHADASVASRAALLSKSDLTTNMVGEFPELQGVMGGYYAAHDDEPAGVAMAIRDHYLPRFAGDILPGSREAQVVAVADRLDTLVGMFALNQIPTGDKDPFGLRRAALGVLRILIENKIHLDLHQALMLAASQLAEHFTCDAKTVAAHVLTFIQERLRAWYLDQGVTADVFMAVAEAGIIDPLDANARINAVRAFKKLPAAEALSIANKRVSNILAKANRVTATHIDSTIFESDAERSLAQALDVTDSMVSRMLKEGDYDQALLKLAELRQPVDTFFNEVMVMADDKARRDNRLLLLSKLRGLFLQVADIALLQ